MATLVPQQQAHSNDASAAVCPDTPPTGTQPCKFRRNLRVGVFFDGTGNNMYNDRGGNHITNVVRLLDVYDDKSDAEYDRDKYYLIGVGAGGPPMDRSYEVVGDAIVPIDTPKKGVRWADQQSDTGTGLMGGMFGLGIKDRCRKAYRWVKERVVAHTDDSHKLIDVYGFSRGAASARNFTGLISQGFPREAHCLNTKVQFLGIFDTVASTGHPGAGWGHAAGMSLGLVSGTDFNAAYHATARDEVREKFPLSLLENNDVPYAGVHSDVGGGYGSGSKTDEGKSNWLAGPPCWHMYKRSMQAGVKFTKPPEMPQVKSALPSGDGPIDEFKATCDKLDGTAGEKTDKASNDWRATYVHDSTQGYSFWGRLKGNWANTVDDTSQQPVYTEAGAFYPQIQKREVLKEPRLKLGSLPPDYSWD
jgi:hypothetical protein